MRVDDVGLRVGALSLLFYFAAPARAAELRWAAPDDCARSANVTAQVERLIGRALGDVAAVDFEVSVQHVTGRPAPWTLVVRTLLPDSAFEPRTRELSGASCAEVTDAAAVAIAMVVQEQANQGSDAAPFEASSADTGSRRSLSAVATPARPAQDGANQSEPTPAASATPTNDGATLRFGIGVGGVLDAGALPSLAFGGQLELSVGVGALRASALGTLFVPQETTLAGEVRGGQFQFALGGLLVCGAPAFGDFRVLGCAGFELGQMSGEGQHVKTAFARDAGWQALRAEVGFTWEFVPRLGLIARVGLTRPFSRPDFVLDGATSLHRPAALTSRILLGIETYL